MGAPTNGHKAISHCKIKKKLIDYSGQRVLVDGNPVLYKLLSGLHRSMALGIPGPGPIILAKFNEFDSLS